MQERETYRWPVRESLKSMLAMGWNIERTKEGDAMFQQRESEKQKKISESLVTKHHSFAMWGRSELLMLVVQIHPKIKSLSYYILVC